MRPDLRLTNHYNAPLLASSGEGRRRPGREAKLLVNNHPPLRGKTPLPSKPSGRGSSQKEASARQGLPLGGSQIRQEVTVGLTWRGGAEPWSLARVPGRELLLPPDTTVWRLILFLKGWGPAPDEL
jgi:hypothetical protein